MRNVIDLSAKRLESDKVAKHLGKQNNIMMDMIDKLEEEIFRQSNLIRLMQLEINELKAKLK